MHTALRRDMRYDVDRLVRDLEAARAARQFIVNGPTEIDGKP